MQQPQPFQKPENALKRADELLSIGQPETALKVLHTAISHKKFRSQGWDTVQEHVLIRYVQMCVDAEELKMAREGLIQCRAVSQQTNIASFGKVITEFRDRAEKRHREAKAAVLSKTQTNQSEQKGILPEDLDGDESPESLLLGTLQVEPREMQIRDLQKKTKYLWDVYKTILDMLKTTLKLDKLYHETAMKAFVFCKENNRAQEFRRLCELLRMHYASLCRSRVKNPDVETSMRPELYVEARLVQLNIACELNLWRESCTTAEDIFILGIHDLFAKSFRNTGEASIKIREKVLRWMAMYYQKLAKIFWVSEIFLFHGLAVLRLLMHYRTYKKNMTSSDFQQMLSAAVLAVLCIPVTATEKEKRIDDLPPPGAMSPENQRRLTSMVGHPSIPSREILKNALLFKDVLSQSHPACQKLYDLLENDFTPLTLCSDSQPLLEELTAYMADAAQTPTASLLCTTAETLSDYTVPLKKIIFHKMILQISKVYCSIRIDFFTKNICPPSFLEWAEAEKMLVQLVVTGAVTLKLDYANKVIFFGSNVSDPARELSGIMSRLGKELSGAVDLLDSDVKNETENRQKELFLQNFHSNLAKAHAEIKKRNAANEENRLHKQAEQQKAENDRRLYVEQQKMIESRLEAQRREEALLKREERRLIEESNKAKYEVAQQLLAEIRQIANSASPNNKFVIRGKTVDEISVEDLINGTITFEHVTKAHETLCYKERCERAKIRSMEARRLEYFLRAQREKTIPLLTAWRQSVATEDSAIHAEIKAKLNELSEMKKNKVLTEKELFSKIIDIKYLWANDQEQIFGIPSFDDYMLKSMQKHP